MDRPFPRDIWSNNLLSKCTAVTVARCALVAGGYSDMIWDSALSIALNLKVYSHRRMLETIRSDSLRELVVSGYRDIDRDILWRAQTRLPSLITLKVHPWENVKKHTILMPAVTSSVRNLCMTWSYPCGLPINSGSYSLTELDLYDYTGPIGNDAVKPTRGIISSKMAFIVALPQLQNLLLCDTNLESLHQLRQSTSLKHLWIREPKLASWVSYDDGDLVRPIQRLVSLMPPGVGVNVMFGLHSLAHTVLSHGTDSATSNVALLLSKGAVDMTARVKRRSWINCAAKYSNVDALKALVSAGFKLDTVNWDGSTIWNCAAAFAGAAATPTLDYLFIGDALRRAWVTIPRELNRRSMLACFLRNENEVACIEWLSERPAILQFLDLHRAMNEDDANGRPLVYWIVNTRWIKWLLENGLDLHRITCDGERTVAEHLIQYPRGPEYMDAVLDAAPHFVPTKGLCTRALTVQNMSADMRQTAYRVYLRCPEHARLEILMDMIANKEAMRLMMGPFQCGLLNDHAWRILLCTKSQAVNRLCSDFIIYERTDVVHRLLAISTVDALEALHEPGYEDGVGLSLLHRTVDALDGPESIASLVKLLCSERGLEGGPKTKAISVPPLMYWLSEGVAITAEHVDALHDAGAGYEGVVDGDGRTILHIAAEHYDGDVMEALLKYAPDYLINLPDDDGWLPIHYALQNEHPGEMVCRLKSHGATCKVEGTRRIVHGS